MQHIRFGIRSCFRLAVILLTLTTATAVRAETLIFSGSAISNSIMWNSISFPSGADVPLDPYDDAPVIVPGSTVTYRYTGLVIFSSAPDFTWNSITLGDHTFAAGDGEVTVNIPASDGYYRDDLHLLGPSSFSEPYSFGTLDIFVTNPDQTGPVLQSIDIRDDGFGWCDLITLHFDELIASGGGFSSGADNLVVEVNGTPYSDPFAGGGADSISPRFMVPVYAQHGEDIVISYSYGGANKLYDRQINEVQEFQLSGTCNATGVFWDGTGPLLPSTDDSVAASDDDDATSGQDDTAANTDTPSDEDTSGSDVATQGDARDTAAKQIVASDIETNLQLNLASGRSLVSAARQRLDRGRSAVVSQAQSLDIFGRLTGGQQGLDGTGRLRFQEVFGATEVFVQGDLRYSSGSGATNGAATLLAIAERRPDRDQIVGMSIGLTARQGQSDGAFDATTGSTALSVGAHMVRRTDPDTIIDGFAVVERERVRASLDDGSDVFEGAFSVWSVGLGASLSRDARHGKLALTHIASVDLGASRHPDVTLTADGGATLSVAAQQIQILTFKYAPELVVSGDDLTGDIRLAPSMNCQIVTDNSGAQRSCGFGAGLRMQTGHAATLRVTGTLDVERVNSSTIGAVGLKFERRF